jgi:hypothetical protein
MLHLIVGFCKTRAGAPIAVITEAGKSKPSWSLVATDDKVIPLTRSVRCQSVL